jgi:hypothetical protein
MYSFTIFLTVVHLFGLALGVGSATVKLLLLLKANKDHDFLPVYLRVAKPITRLLITGIILLTLSGIGFLFIGYSFTPLLITKLVLVVLVFVLGSVIDNVTEPKLRDSVLVSAGTATPAFNRIFHQHLALEIAATFLMYTITFIGVLL